MYPEGFAERWIDARTHPGDVVLDPFCGRGTGPFQGLLMGRRAIGVDINPVAYCVSKAKLNAPQARSVTRRISQLEQQYVVEDWTAAASELPEFFDFAYHPATLRQLLYLRDSLRWRRSTVIA